MFAISDFTTIDDSRIEINTLQPTLQPVCCMCDSERDLTAVRMADDSRLYFCPEHLGES